jgi:urease accessory protein UreH
VKDKQTFEIGELLIRVKTGKTAVVLESRASGRPPYGKTSARQENRQLYRIYEDGREVWKHDLQIAAEYKRPPQIS